MIGETENPLTEVALALSMAFFSLMVLMLFAITNAPQSAAAQSAQIKSAASAEKTDAKPAYLIFYKGAYYDEKLQPASPDSPATDQPLLLAVMPELNVGAMMQAMRTLSHPEPEVVTLTQDWIDALEKMGAGK